MVDLFTNKLARLRAWRLPLAFIFLGSPQGCCVILIRHGHFSFPKMDALKLRGDGMADPR
jgi:hypothetical protein